MMVLLTFFILGLAACVSCRTCPPGKDILPCTCSDSISKEIFVDCRDHTMSLDDLKQALNGLSKKKDIALTLHGLILGKVPSNFFSGLHINFLYIDDCWLDSLSDGVDEPALLGLENSLRGLSIESSFTEENVPARLNIGHLRKLFELKLVSNSITELGNDWFKHGPYSLEILDIRKNGIKRLGDKAFRNLVNLYSVKIKENWSGPFQRSMLPYTVKRLKFLFINDTYKTVLPANFFKDFRSLNVLAFENMGISRLEKETWERILRKLHSVYLLGNPLECDSHMKWMFEIPIPEYFEGDCTYAEKKDGRSLKNFIRSKGKANPKYKD